MGFCKVTKGLLLACPEEAPWEDTFDPWPVHWDGLEEVPWVQVHHRTGAGTGAAVGTCLAAVAPCLPAVAQAWQERGGVHCTAAPAGPCGCLGAEPGPHR